MTWAKASKGTHKKWMREAYATYVAQGTQQPQEGAPIVATMPEPISVIEAAPEAFKPYTEEDYRLAKESADAINARGGAAFAMPVAEMNAILSDPRLQASIAQAKAAIPVVSA